MIYIMEALRSKNCTDNAAYLLHLSSKKFLRFFFEISGHLVIKCPVFCSIIWSVETFVHIKTVCQVLLVQDNLLDMSDSC